MWRLPFAPHIWQNSIDPLRAGSQIEDRSTYEPKQSKEATGCIRNKTKTEREKETHPMAISEHFSVQNILSPGILSLEQHPVTSVLLENLWRCHHSTNNLFLQHNKSKVLCISL